MAQLDRATGYEPVGWEFESLRAHHYIIRILLGQLGYIPICPFAFYEAFKAAILRLASIFWGAKDVFWI